MKWSFNHKSRKAFLTAAICLALSQSVFAMPTGGKVVDGTVTGIDTVASGGTINVNSNALIDWETFNIAKGETLNFTFSKDYLNVINHVTGDEMSKLLGTLNAKNGNVYLINPNGILVGSGARIDAGSLVLSTLNATDDQLKSALQNGFTNLDLTSKAGSKGITIENGANIQVGPFLGLLGNKVQIADNVTISDAPYDKNETTLVVAAADKASLVLTGGGAEDIASVTTGKDNTVTIGKADFNINNNFTDSYFLGNAISMKGTNLNINSRDQGNSITALDIIAADSYKMGKDDAVSLTMNPANRIDLDDVKASADYMHVIGGQTAINQSDLTLTKTTDAVTEGTLMPYMKIAALNGNGVILNDLEDVPQNTVNTDGANLTIKDSKLTSNENIALWGGSVELTNTNLKTLEETNVKDNNIDIDAFKSFDDKGVTTDSFNTVKVTGGSLESGGDISVQGSSIALDGVKDVKSTTDKPDKGIFLMAGKKFTFTDNDEYLENNTDANAISIKNTTMSTNKAMALIGGKVDVTDGSNLTAGDLEVVAGSSYKDEGNTIEGTDTTNLTVSASTIHSNEDLTLVGSNINLANTELEVGTPTDHEYGSNGIVRIAAAKAVGLVDEDGKGFTVGSVDKTGNLTMNKVTLSAQGNVMAYGNNVTVNASGIKTQNSTGKENDLSLNALNHYERKYGSDDTWEAGKDNTLTVTDSKLTNNDMVELVGGNVALDKAEITAGDASVAARSGYKSVKVNKDNDTTVLRHDAADGMNVSIKDSKITSESGLGITGHDVTIDSKKNLSAKDFLAVGTGSAVTTDFEKKTVAANGKAVKVSKDTTFESDHKVIVPGIEVIDNTKPSDPGTKPSDPSTKPSDPGTQPSDPGTKPIDPGTKPSDPGTQPSDPGTQPTDPGTKPSDPGTKPTEPDQPSKPDKPVVTPDPKPAVDVEKNIEQGKQDMTKTLADNQDNASAAVKQQAEKLSSSKMTDEEKAAQVKGYAEAIENSQASVEEKQVLVKDTVKSFEPTQQSSLEAQNKQDEAAQNNNAQTVIPDVTVKNVAPAEHEGAAATVTVDGTVVND